MTCRPRTQVHRLSSNFGAQTEHCFQVYSLNRGHSFPQRNTSGRCVSRIGRNSAAFWAHDCRIGLTAVDCLTAAAHMSVAAMVYKVPFGCLGHVRVVPKTPESTTHTRAPCRRRDRWIFSQKMFCQYRAKGVEVRERKATTNTTSG